jgi:hypothetical protein
MARTSSNTGTRTVHGKRPVTSRRNAGRMGLAALALLAWAGCGSISVADDGELDVAFGEEDAAGSGACAVGGSAGDVIQGSGTSVTLEVPLADFSGVDASCVYDVQAVRADAFEVTIEVDDNLAEFLDVRVEDGSLVLDVQPGTFEFTRLRASVSLPQLDAFDLSGAAALNVTGFVSDQPLVALTSADASAAGDIVAGDTLVLAEGNSRVTLAGSGNDLRLGASGSASVDLRDYPVQDVTAEVDGAGESIVLVEGRLDAVASGVARLRFLGDPELGVIEENALGSVEPF